jgi:phage shock protein C
MNTNAPRRLVRTTDDRMIAGVCGGIADLLGIDATIVRVVAVVAAVVFCPVVPLIYLLLWAIIPQGTRTGGFRTGNG